jgi:two-component system LytT family response regulator
LEVKVVIADAELPSRNLLRHYTQLLSEYKVVGEASTGEELFQKVMEERPDIVLVDINMPGINGFEAVKACLKVFPSLMVIFTTDSVEFAVDAFNIWAVDYIVKPIERVRLFIALGKAQKMIQLHNSLEVKRIKRSSNKFTIKSNNSFLYLSPEDILFIEKEARKTIVHMSNNKFETIESLKVIVERLPEYFYKTHRSYLVNLNKISKIESSSETYVAKFFGVDKVAYISRLKINEVHRLMST